MEQSPSSVPTRDPETEWRVDCEHHEDLLAENYELRAELIATSVVVDDLRRRMANLKEENTRLKEGISQLMLEAKFQRMHSETRRRWDFYHAHKNEILAELSEQHGLDDRPSWHIIKRLTDEAFERLEVLSGGDGSGSCTDE